MSANNKLIGLFISSLALLILAQVGASASADSAADSSSASTSFDPAIEVGFLCKDKPSKTLIDRISQVKSIIDYVNSNEQQLADCQQYRQSILDLESTITKDLNDVCTVEKVDKIRQYHEKYIALNPKSNQTEAAMPKSLRNFFLAYGIKVSYVCKKNMINSLLYDPHRLLNEQDFKAMDLWTSKGGSMMNDIIGGPVDYDDLLLASDLSFIRSDSGSYKDEKLFIQTSTSKLIKKIQLVCKRRFKPFYEKLILPLVNLSNLGYNFQGEELERELKEMRTNKEVDEWYKLVYLCESLDDMEILDFPQDQVKGLGDQEKVVSILTEEEARKFKEENPQLAGDLIDSDLDKKFPQIEYNNQELEGGQIPIDDVVFDKEDKQLRRLIANFDAKQKESDRIRGKVMRKLSGFVGKVLKNKQIKFVTNFFKKKLFDQNPEEESKHPVVGNHAKEDMVYAIDEFVTLNTDADSTDLPVAGVLDYVKRVHHNSVYLGPSGVANKITSATKYWTLGRVFWYVIAGLLLAIGISLISTALG